MDALLAATGLAVSAAVAVASVAAVESLSSTRRLVRVRALGESTTTLAAPAGVTSQRRRSRPNPHLGRLGFDEKTAKKLEQAGVQMRLGEFAALRIVLFVISYFVFALIGDRFSTALAFKVLELVLALVCAWKIFPDMFLNRLISKRLRAIEAELPDALTLMAKSLRAGVGLLQALSYAANETPSPLGPEFQRTLRDLELGRDPQHAFDELSRRVQSKDLDIALTAIMIQRSVGGNLSEILGNVVNTARERQQLKAEAHALTARQMLTANMVAAMPVLVAVLFLLINSHVASLLFNTTAGKISLFIGITFEIIGLWLVRRLAVIEV